MMRYTESCLQSIIFGSNILTFSWIKSVNYDNWYQSLSSIAILNLAASKDYKYTSDFFIFCIYCI